MSADPGDGAGLPDGSSTADARRSPIARVLGLFTRVEEPEVRSSMLLLSGIFLILTAYYLIKPAREGWLSVSAIAGLSKIEVKAFASFGQVVLLLGLVRLYARLVGIWPRGRLVRRVNLFLTANLAFFWLFHPGFLVEEIPYLGVAFYLWVGIFNVFIVAQFWAYVADYYTLERGRRLFPLVAIGANAGAVFGAWLAEKLVERAGLLSFHLMICAVVPLLLAALLIGAAERRGPVGGGLEPVAGTPEAPEGTGTASALALIRRHPLLWLTAVLTLVSGWVSANGENVLFAAVQMAVDAQASAAGVVDAADLKAFTLTSTTSFYGNFYFWVNLCGLTLQAFVVSRLLRFGGFGTIFLALPLVSVFGYLAMAMVPVLGVIKTAKVLENSTSYSIHNTARGVFWLPTTTEMKFKAKQAVDTLFVRLGDGMAALTVLVGVSWLGMPATHIFSLNVGLALVWLVLAVAVVRERRPLLGGR